MNSQTRKTTRRGGHFKGHLPDSHLNETQLTPLPSPQDGLELHEGSLGLESRLTRHYLHLINLTPQDAGTYTCAAANPLGAAAANWTLRVIGE